MSLKQAKNKLGLFLLYFFLYTLLFVPHLTFKHMHITVANFFLSKYQKKFLFNTLQNKYKAQSVFYITKITCFYSVACFF